MAITIDAFELIEKYFTQRKELYGDNYYMEKSGRLSSFETMEEEPEENIEEEPEGVMKNWEQIKDLGDFNDAVKNCQECLLGRSRTNFVFGVGNPNADLLFIGEAPGRDEDLKGEPFVGRAGKLLDKILGAIDLDRSKVYIANILKCRPPKNRDPQTGEIASCEPYLIHQIKIIKPKLIVALGRVAAQTLLRSTDTLGNMRNKIHDYNGTDLMVTYHPAALLRNPGFKKPTWEDMQKIRDLYLNKSDN
ncbi:uracil-DNA glycosylase family protein [candidate division KSB1 bacterium]